MTTPKTVAKAEQSLYLSLLSLSHHYSIAEQWLKCLPDWLAHIKNKHRYANAPYYGSIVDKLPTITKRKQIDLNAKNVSAFIELSAGEYKQTEALLKNLMPWRKGGFVIGQGEHTLHIDTEWRSDLKWDRVLPHLSDLTGRRVLDVGGGSGYHGYRMVGAGADMVMVVDPSPLFYYQFMAIHHFIGELTNRYGLSPIHFLPVPLDALPSGGEGLFHTVFCMGVLYHRPSPFDCLWQLKQQLTKGGELVLETLVVEGDETTVLVPKERYAMMNNVYFLPSVKALTLWLKKAGFCKVRCVDINTTTTKEQRATPWMSYQSLSDFLDPDDNSKTIEGYPAPTRAVMIAEKC